MTICTHVDASISGNFQHIPNQSSEQLPKRQHWKALPALPLCLKLNSLLSCQAVRQTCHPAQGDRREGARKRKRQRHPSYTHSCCCVCTQRQGEASRLVPATRECLCQCERVLLLEMGNDRNKAYLLQLHSLSVMGTAINSEASIAQAQRQISKVGCSTPSTGRTMLFYLLLQHCSSTEAFYKTCWRASDSKIHLCKLLFFKENLRKCLSYYTLSSDETFLCILFTET